MMHLAYITCLLTAIGLLVLADFRQRLAFFYDWRRTSKTLGAAIVIFLVWDIMGVALQVFYPGNNEYSLGIIVLPGVPLEEILFLSLFTYLTLIVWKVYADLRRA
jgi:lycopene cyclase domain-containing protein